MKYIELGMMKVVLIRVIKGKKIINIVLKIEMAQIFWDTFFFCKWFSYYGTERIIVFHLFNTIVLINIINSSMCERSRHY